MKKVFLGVLAIATSFTTFSFAHNKNANKTDTFLEQNKQNVRVILEDDGGGGYSGVTNYSFNMKTYFRNSYTYVPVNHFGSCEFIALGQILSYYDTFYNDNIVPEQYERKNTTATSYSNAILNSPGFENTTTYPTGDYNGKNYRAFCYYKQDICLQSKLTILDNKRRNFDDDTHFRHGSYGYDTFQNVLDDFYGESGKVQVTRYHKDIYSQDILKSLIRYYIDNNTPVLVAIGSDNVAPGSTDLHRYHGVVAYDYDSTNIYANFGWGSGTTHQKLLEDSTALNKYQYIRYILTFDFAKMGHKHSNNYIINGVPYCAHCGYGNDYLNQNKYQLAINTTSQVKKVTWGYNFLSGNASSFDVHILNAAGNEIKTYLNTPYHEQIFTEEDWNEISVFSGGKIGFYVVAHNSSNNQYEGSSTLYTNISTSVSNSYFSGNFVFNNYSRLLEFLPSLSISSPIKVYKIKFEQSGRKMFQTFANAILNTNSFYVVSESTGVILNANRFGYKNNPFMHQYLAAGTYYVVLTGITSCRFEITQTTSNYYSCMGTDNVVPWQFYNDIKIIRPDVERHSFLMQHHENIVATFTPESTRTYTLKIESSFDSYLYVLDPRKTTSMGSNGCEFNDDGVGGGSLNAKITAALTAGIPYYIVITQYNSAAAFSSGSTTTVTLVLS